MIENTTLIITPDLVNAVYLSVTWIVLAIGAAFFVGVFVGYMSGSQKEWNRFRRLSLTKPEITVKDAMDLFREFD